MVVVPGGSLGAEALDLLRGWLLENRGSGARLCRDGRATGREVNRELWEDMAGGRTERFSAVQLLVSGRGMDSWAGSAGCPGLRWAGVCEREASASVAGHGTRGRRCGAMVPGGRSNS